jgi:hypothetical protein
MLGRFMKGKAQVFVLYLQLKDGAVKVAQHLH